MSRKVKITKVAGGSTIVETYDSATPTKKNIVNYNNPMDVEFDTQNNIIRVIRFDKSAFHIVPTELVGMTATTVEALSAEFSTKKFFVQ